MTLLKSLLVCTLCLGCLIPQSIRAEDGTEARRLTAQAEAMLWFGLAENGRVSEFRTALDLLDRAEASLAAAEVSDLDRTTLELRIGSLQDDLQLNLERSQRKFYGKYPMTRLVVPFSSSTGRDDVTETLHFLPDNEAVRGASERVIADIVRLQYPHVVFRSDPQNRAYESEAMRVFAGANRPFAHNRGELLDALTLEDAEAFDRGDFDRAVVDRLMQAFGAVKMVVLTIREEVDLPDGTLVVLEGVFYETGTEEPTDSFAHMGFSRARRGQIPRIAWAHVGLLAIALVVAASTRWSLKAPWPMIQRLAMGAALFLVGRVFAPVAVMLLRRIVPHPDASAAGSWWWPALVGLVTILGSGFVAWLIQARTSRIVPGSRSSRAVGMIFVLGALGACAYFIEPLLLLDPGRGFTLLAPLVLSSLTLAALTGYSIRTGPPVPLYFALGTVILAALVGLGLLAMNPGMLWWMVAASAALCALAGMRHKYAVAHQLEEAEPDEEEAERKDLERLEKFGKDFEKKLPI